MTLRKYIGENVYAEFKGNKLVLTLEPDAGPPTNTISIGSITFTTLLTWMKAVMEVAR